MPFKEGPAVVGGNLEAEIQRLLDQFLELIDKEVAALAKQKGLVVRDIKLLHPINYCVIVTDQFIQIVATNQNVGGMPHIQYIDLQDQQINLQTAIFLAERDLAYTNAFGISFSKELLKIPVDQKGDAAKEIADQYINDELIAIERLSKTVRINPIFEGREFLVNDKLVFVLSPFGEPFDTIYKDHIKPTVEKIDNINCIRADDIYDNRPIIEDIWKSINEASIVIAELTGRNPNVFYETGVAHTVGKEVILITQTMDDVPFDLKHLRCIVYEYTPKGIKLLETNLTNTINNIRQRTKKK